MTIHVPTVAEILADTVDDLDKAIKLAHGFTATTMTEACFPMELSKVKVKIEVCIEELNG